MSRQIIQGGMGVYISKPHLARCTSLNDNALGTVSCVAVERIVPRILQLGDHGGDYRRALSHFPFPEVAERIIETYFVEGGIAPDQKFKPVPAFSLPPRSDLSALTVAASFAFVWLAKEGHTGPVSMNLLEKIQGPIMPQIFGAMLGGVDYVTMGAGITLQIPGVLDAFEGGDFSSYRVTVLNSTEGIKTISFNPQELFKVKQPKLKRPGFLPIVSTHVLAELMNKRLPKGSIQGFIVEKPIAGGHNASPRGKLVLGETGEPVYGTRDEVAFDKLRDLGIPFWIGGGFASPEGLAMAKSLGATGIQAGSIFALCEDSGMVPDFRNEIRRLGYRGELVIRTDPKASPTQYPFKVVQLPHTHSESGVYNDRERVCDLCALAIPYQKDNGSIVFRCPGEPVENYVHKFGKIEDTIDTRCLCNGLLSASGLGSPCERPIFTLGDDVSFLRHLMKDEGDSYSAADAIAYLLQSS